MTNPSVSLLDTSRVRAASAPSISPASTPAIASMAQQVGERKDVPRSVWRVVSVAASIALLGGLAIGMFVLRRPSQAVLPVYHPLTFRRGMVQAARFAPDGRTIIYS